MKSQAVICQLSPSEICVKQSDTGADIYEKIQFAPQIIILPMLHPHLPSSVDGILEVAGLRSISGEIRSQPRGTSPIITS